MKKAEAAKLEIDRSGLTPKLMAEWADQNILRLLNLPDNPITNRVRTVVELCKQAIVLAEQAPYPGSPFDVPRVKRHDVLTELNRLLAKYKWHPRTLMGHQPHLIVRYEFTAKNDGAEFENRAVQWLMDHIDVVSRIRRCRRCQLWLFAVTEHQKYCSDTCRKQEAAQGVVFKEKRKIYMKKYRSDETARNARARRLAKGKMA